MADNKKLHILWTNADATTAKLMVMMYATNSMLRGWWDEVTVVLWGATSKYVAEDETIQEYVRQAQAAGVRFEACIACARELGVIEQLEALDVSVFSWGPPLTELLQSGAPLITI